MGRDRGGTEFQLLPCMDIKREAGSIHIVQQRYAVEPIDHPLRPLAQAIRFREHGARYLHVVDMDGVLSGEPRNIDVVRTLVAETGLRVELLGGAPAGRSGTAADLLRSR